MSSRSPQLVAGSNSGSEPPSPILVAHVKSAPADSRKDSQKPSSSRHASLASSRVSRTDGRRSSVRRSLDWLERARRNRKESLKARKERKVEMGLKAFGDALRNPMKSLKKTLLVSMIILSVFIFCHALLSLPWHWVHAELWYDQGGPRAYLAHYLIWTQALWEAALLILCFVGIKYTLKIDEEALLHAVRRIIGVETEEGEDALAGFRDLGEKLATGLDSYDQLRKQLEQIAVSGNQLAGNANKFVENLRRNKGYDGEEAFEVVAGDGFDDSEEKKESMINDVREAIYEVWSSLAHEPGHHYRVQPKNVELVKQVRGLVRELKQWSAPKGHSPGAPLFDIEEGGDSSGEVSGEGWSPRARPAITEDADEEPSRYV